MTMPIFGIQLGGLAYQPVRLPPCAANQTHTWCDPVLVNSDIR